MLLFFYLPCPQSLFYSMMCKLELIHQVVTTPLGLIIPCLLPCQLPFFWGRKKKPLYYRVINLLLSPVHCPEGMCCVFEYSERLSCAYKKTEKEAPAHRHLLKTQVQVCFLPPVLELILIIIFFKLFDYTVHVKYPAVKRKKQYICYLNKLFVINCLFSAFIL